jgi:excisionase family DNA binding protein
MYAAVRRYRTNPLAATAPQEISQIIEQFIPFIRDTVLAYYVLEVEDGTFMSITIGEDEAQVEESNRVAAEWLKHYLARSIVSQESMTGFALAVDDPIQGRLHEGFSEPEYKRSLQLLSVKEVAELLRMGRSWVYQQIKSGELPSVHLGGTVKVKRVDLEEYVEKHRSPPSSEK